MTLTTLFFKLLPSGWVATFRGTELSPRPCLLYATTRKEYLVSGLRFWMVTCISPGRLVFTVLSLRNETIPSDCNVSSVPPHWDLYSSAASLSRHLITPSGTTYSKNRQRHAKTQCRESPMLICEEQGYSLRPTFWRLPGRSRRSKWCHLHVAREAGARSAWWSVWRRARPLHHGGPRTRDRDRRQGRGWSRSCLLSLVLHGQQWHGSVWGRVRGWLRHWLEASGEWVAWE